RSVLERQFQWLCEEHARRLASVGYRHDAVRRADQSRRFWIEYLSNTSELRGSTESDWVHQLSEVGSNTVERKQYDAMVRSLGIRHQLHTRLNDSDLRQYAEERAARSRT